jgi:hypothetical protein
MKKEINFYEVEEGVVKAMAPVFLKILDEKKRAFEEKNLNNADYLNFLKDFSRSFYFFENSPNCLNAKADNFYKKQAGKWTKVLN